MPMPGEGREGSRASNQSKGRKKATKERKKASQLAGKQAGAGTASLFNPKRPYTLRP